MVRFTSSLLLFAVAVFTQAQLYFSDLFMPDIFAGHINRVNPDGTNGSVLMNLGGGIRGLAIDPAAGKMYWADVNDWVIRRANLDGSGQEDVVHLQPIGEDPPFPSAVAVDAGKVYWGDQLLGTISRANTDGTGVEVLLSTPFHRGLAIDSEHGKMYWTTSDSDVKGEIWKANLDGTNRQRVVTSQDFQFKPNKIALDIAGGKIYWTDYVVDVVQRANLDGTNIETLYVPPFNRNPQGITLDLQNGLIYWGQDIEIETHDGKIMSMNLDGSNAQDLVSGFGHVNEIIYVSDTSTESLPPIREEVMLGTLNGGGNLGSWARDDSNSRTICKLFVPTSTSPFAAVRLSFKPALILEPGSMQIKVKVDTHTPGPQNLGLSMLRSNGSTYDRSSVYDTPVVNNQVYTGTVPLPPLQYRQTNGEYKLLVEVWQRGPSTQLFPCVSFEYANLVMHR